MADTMRPASFLPHIKCSTCHVEIAIAAMGDHVCGKAESAPEAVPWRTKQANSAATTLAPAGSMTSGQGRTVPKSIDPLAANGPFLRRDAAPHGLGPLTKSSTMPCRRSPSPSDAYNKAPSTSRNELSNLDCAFPPFPRSRTAPDLSAEHPYKEHAKPMRPFDLKKLEGSPTHGPLSPNTFSGESVVRKMSNIAPGPFAIKDQSPPSSNHKRDVSEARSLATSTPMRQSRSANGLPARAVEERDNLHRTMQTAFEQSRNAVPFKGPFGGIGDVYGGRGPVGQQRMMSATGQSSHMPKASLSPPRTADSIRRPREAAQDQKYTPLRSGSVPGSYEPTASPPRRPTEPATRYGTSISSPQSLPGRYETGRARPPVEDQIHSRPTTATDQVPPLVSAGARSWDQRPKHWLDRAQAGSMSSRTEPATNDQPHHSPAESWSSNGSSSTSDARTSSSRSTPPMPASPEMLSQKTYGGGAPLHFRNESPSTPLPSSRYEAPQPGGRPPSSGRIDRPGTSASSSSASRTYPPESPLDPALHGNILRSALDAPPATRPLPGLAVDSSRRPSKASKGNCRGCNEEIHGKSVSSADGQLSGRYHKHCFVCKTCREPFTSTTFYVLDNHPYCERHYHQLNNSLCHACDGGIEGQYLETDRMVKYHPDCLTCHDCRIILRHDYFEMNGRVYCEHDAFKLARQASFSGAGRRNPERRTTRLLRMG